MEVSEKKLGCLKGIKRTNLDNCGYIEGSVNESLKSGQKQVCVEEGKAIFWIVNDFDVTVTPEDIASYSIDGVNVFTRESSKNINNQRVFFYEYTTNYNINFTNGKNGVLKVSSIKVYQKESDYNVINKEAFRINKCPKGYVPEVAGWLAPNGSKDENYNAIFCPEGYTADIVGFRKVSINSPCIKLAKALGLPEVALQTKVEFGGEKLSFIRV